MARIVKRHIAASHFNVNDRTLERWIGDGKIIGYKAGPGDIRVDLDEIQQRIDAGIIRDGRRKRYGERARIVPMPVEVAPPPPTTARSRAPADADDRSPALIDGDDDRGGPAVIAADLRVRAPLRRRATHAGLSVVRYKGGSLAIVDPTTGERAKVADDEAGHAWLDARDGDHERARAVARSLPPITDAQATRVGGLLALGRR